MNERCRHKSSTRNHHRRATLYTSSRTRGAKNNRQCLLDGECSRAERERNGASSAVSSHGKSTARNNRRVNSPTEEPRPAPNICPTWTSAPRNNIYIYIYIDARFLQKSNRKSYALYRMVACLYSPEGSTQLITESIQPNTHTHLQTCTHARTHARTHTHTHTHIANDLDNTIKTNSKS